MTPYHANGYRALGAAVLHHAVSDATCPCPRGTGKDRKAVVAQWTRMRDEALQFLSNEEGPWEASRRFWCAVAGLSGMADRTLQRIIRANVVPHGEIR